MTTAEPRATGLGTARAVPWDPDTDIDWSAAVAPPVWLTKRTFAGVISQLRHGEQATADACAGLLAVETDPEARVELAAQVADERRHVHAYDAYLARLGERMPVDPDVAEVYERAAAWPGSPLATAIAFHVVLEGEALALHGDFQRWFRCPLLTQITCRVARDEGRHVAFGRAYLRRQLAAVSPDERHQMATWIEALWRQAARATVDRHRGRLPLPAALIERRLDGRWQRHARALAALDIR